MHTTQPLRNIGVVASVLLLLATACSSFDSDLRQAALALSNASIACVDDVKTLRVKYETSGKCQALGPLAQNYFDLGGLTAKSPNDFEAIYERARVYAWMAKAISASGEPNQSIWDIKQSRAKSSE